MKNIMILMVLILSTITLTNCGKDSSTSPDLVPPVTSAPYNPYPADGATGLPTSLTLSWDYNMPSGGGITFDIYFSSSSVPVLLAVDYTYASIHVSQLQPSTRYYWRVIAKNADGDQMSSALWQFVTAE